MLNIEGIWSASFEDVENADPALLHIKDGKITGDDPHGGRYEGSYEQKGEKVKITVTVRSNFEGAETIFPGVPFPLIVEAYGEYTSPDFLSLIGKVNDKYTVVVNCRRIGDPIEIERQNV